MLIQWVFAEKDDLKDKRNQLIKDRETLVKLIMDELPDKLTLIKDLLIRYNKNNTEQLSSKLLEEITKNTGFETNKKQLGQCFVNNCCEFENRQDNDICGLDIKRLTHIEKTKALVDFSILKDAFEKAGLVYDNNI